MELIGSKPISGLLVSSSNTPEVRLLSSTSITRLLQYYEPVRHPTRPSLLLTEFSLRATTSRRWGFPCFGSISSSRHADDTTPAEPLDAVAILSNGHGLPLNPGGSASATSHFRGRAPPVGWSGVHSRFGLPVRSITQGDLYQSTSTHLLPPASLWLLPAERPIGRVGFAPTGDRLLSRRTEFMTPPCAGVLVSE